MKKNIYVLIVICALWLIIIACSFDLSSLNNGAESSSLALTVTANAIMLEQAQADAAAAAIAVQPQEETQPQNISTEVIETPPPEEEDASAFMITETSIPPTISAPRSKEEIEALTDTFDSVYLRDTWTIYRPLMGKYSLEDKRGWLHIVGQKKLSEGYTNVFAQRITSDDIVVTTKIGGVFIEPSQGVWLSFSPAEYQDNSRSVAVAVDSYGFGYRVMMWECREEKLCVETSLLGQNKFKYPGYVYLRLERRGKDYIGYYSVDGKQWIFIGQTNNFPVITDQVILGSGCMNCKNDFDAYIDFVEFTVR